MNHKKTALSRIFQPVLVFLISTAILYVSCKSFIDMSADMLWSALIQGDQGYKDNFEKLNKIEYINQVESNHGDVTVPQYGEQYATIEFKNYDINIPLYYGDDNEILKLGAGQYTNGVVPGMDGTILIGGHDMTYFKKLDMLKKDNLIIIKTEYGAYQYKVADIAILSVEDATKACQDYQGVILYTCYPFGNVESKGRERYLVFCTIDKEVVHDEAK